MNSIRTIREPTTVITTRLSDVQLLCSPEDYRLALEEDMSAEAVCGVQGSFTWAFYTVTDPAGRAELTIERHWHGSTQEEESKTQHLTVSDLR